MTNDALGRLVRPDPARGLLRYVPGSDGRTQDQLTTAERMIVTAAFYQVEERSANNKIMREARIVAALATKEERDAALAAIEKRVGGPAGSVYRIKVERFARMVFVAAKRSKAGAQPELGLA